MSVGVGWWKGGRVERLAAAILTCDYLLTQIVAQTPVPHSHQVVTVVTALTTLIFIRLALRFDRWWLFAAAAALVLCSLVGFMGFVNPDLTRNAVVSAQIGLWIVVYATMLAGVGERWIAGERPVGANRHRPPQPP